MILSDERYDALLSGEPPLNEDEAIWLKNYREKQHQEYLKMKARDEFHHKEILQANREFYALLKSTLPKSFFYKKPVSIDEFNNFRQDFLDKNDSKIESILENPILRLMNGLPPKHPSGDDYGPRTFLTEKLFNKEIKKKYGVNIILKALEYRKYCNNSFCDKAKAIGEKYHTSIFYSFDIYYYLTDWQDYNV